MFKICTMCNFQWQSRAEFLTDSHIKINGYTPDFDNLQQGLFYFTHYAEGCGSTITLTAENFWDLHKGKQFKGSLLKKDTCPGYCLQKNQLDRCSQHCECAHVREIIQLIKEKEINGKL